LLLCQYYFAQINNSYLNHSGFYDYVHAKHPAEVEDQNHYPEKEVVKIEREKKLSNIEPREDKIISLLQQFSLFDARQIELFNSIILTEAFNNVTEHGVSHRDRGWWLLAQYHKKHGIISLCIADNGIGIRNTLMTGPQSDDIGKSIANTPENDGKFIKMAIEETVSGALAAPLKTAGGFLSSKKYEKGAHRGNGLKRITSTCEKLGIPFTILSHHGYVFLDASGNMIRNGSMPRRVFAGTLYHLLIPAKGDMNNAND
jgi:anti-sigma regulatory factor (Ser/Thr protein kinase)